MNNAQASSWSVVFPVVPGLYWKTVYRNILCWHTTLMSFRVEYRLDGSKAIKVTDVTPRFVREAPSEPTTQTHYDGNENFQQAEYFLGPIQLPASPIVDRSSPMDKVPPQPGFYYHHVIGHEGNGLHNRLVSASIHRSTGFEDQVWVTSVPDLEVMAARAWPYIGYSRALELTPPSKLPNGQDLVFPIAQRQGTR